MKNSNQQLELVRKNPYAIMDIVNPSEEIQIAAVSIRGDALEFIKNASFKVQLAAVRQDGTAIQFADNILSPELQEAAVMQNPEAIKFFRGSEELQIKAVQGDWEVIRFLLCSSDAVMLAAIKQDIRALSYLSVIEGILSSVDCNGFTYYYIEGHPEYKMYDLDSVELFIDSSNIDDVRYTFGNHIRVSKDEFINFINS